MHGKIYFVGVGGQGSLRASTILGEALLDAGEDVVMSEIHGMAQRGGIVETTLAYGGSRSPVLGRGEADLFVAFEPLEAYRAMHYVSRETTAVVHTRPIVPFMVALGVADYPEVDTLLAKLGDECKALRTLDALELALRAGSEKAVNVVVLGALVGAGLVPVTEEGLWRAVQRNLPEKIHAVNREALSLGAAKGRSWLERAPGLSAETG